ncbi:FbpB family small basic protein [Siminovitchia sp. 179-K 8D1 HS]
MKKTRRKTFMDLVQENKEMLLRDLDALEKIEDRLEQRHVRKL